MPSRLDLVLQRRSGGCQAAGEGGRGAKRPFEQPWRSAHAASWLWHAMSEQPALLTQPGPEQDEETTS